MFAIPINLIIGKYQFSDKDKENNTSKEIIKWLYYYFKINLRLFTKIKFLVTTILQTLTIHIYMLLCSRIETERIESTTRLMFLVLVIIIILHTTCPWFLHGSIPNVASDCSKHGSFTNASDESWKRWHCGKSLAHPSDRAWKVFLRSKTWIWASIL